MVACLGCRLELPVGTSGYCDPCYLAGKVSKVVNHRYPTSKARELTHLLAKVLTTLESDCEHFEADRASGAVRKETMGRQEFVCGRKLRTPGALDP